MIGRGGVSAPAETRAAGLTQARDDDEVTVPVDGLAVKVASFQQPDSPGPQSLSRTPSLPSSSGVAVGLTMQSRTSPPLTQPEAVHISDRTHWPSVMSRMTTPRQTWGRGTPSASRVWPATDPGFPRYSVLAARGASPASAPCEPLPVPGEPARLARPARSHPGPSYL